MERLARLLVALGAAASLLGFVMVLCAAAAAGDLADVRDFAVRSNDDPTPFLVILGVCSLLVIVGGAAAAVVAAAAAGRGRR